MKMVTFEPATCMLLDLNSYVAIVLVKTDHELPDDFISQSWFASAFYLGYLFATEPAAWILQRFHTGRVMGITSFIWGIVVMFVHVSLAVIPFFSS
jgi:hypothetical protein